MGMFFPLVLSCLVATGVAFQPEFSRYSQRSFLSLRLRRGIEKLSLSTLEAETPRGGSRRERIGEAAANAIAVPLLSAGLLGSPRQVRASALPAGGKSKVVVAGATGQTGMRVVNQLRALSNVSPVAAVRDPQKGEKIFGADVEKLKLDVVKDSPGKMAEALKSAGADALVCAVGFSGGNPFEWSKQAHAVDNVGTVALIDAAKEAGVKKFVLITSILTDGRAWGQEKSPGFQVTNAFGGVLDEKLTAEKHLKSSGLDFTIVRPAGLRGDGPSRSLVVTKENSLNSGEVSRDTVARVCVSALFAPSSEKKIVEIVETENVKATPEVDWFSVA
uniref:NAD(P)-binding domain-containing protein n=1 Tax=Chromera velia CCMP2878 TaxID=1169474 RepID=A0A0G4IDB1_9ALVE|mmetsp:Transcript_3049/g.6213  ORF Transcript_3049/g.6213 Transcript_3049/m.6213 type:complete len:332 (-) Transcript_3049:229-1224(-)|eukprot:Cvel_13284.t1-p1 / transcript=Cvel_13284.t1 / gene=Cvel_13284 / organism=Chromera_velia_CCMP2878 / gene_product=Uncharacterized protein At2g34460, chloroplastic, putative / transcript_product=Uncharacterized protein At2g34460, chloroplastic, putative / location=Cvel_scaffold901:36253-37245(+) / protein_length=331 / sequence_SO=supercontig / SO=protein_coding / is_pseudo=false